MLATRFIIALCPTTPIYLVKFDVPAKRIFSRHAATISTETTRVKTEALVFDTFEAAMEVAKDITGWGGAQRVEQVAVEVEDTRSTLDTPEARIEVRDNATAQYNAAREAGYAERNAAEEVAVELRSLGIKVGVDYRDGASCTVSLHLADHLGNLLTLDWDPMQDGFAYETEGDDACDIGESEAQHEAEPDTVTCDGCEANDAEPCGDSEGFAFCAACRAKSQDAPKAGGAITFDAAFLDAVLGRDDLTMDQTPLTPEQAKHARAALTAALRSLVYANLPRLASSALVEAREYTDADEPADDGDDDRYYSGTGESMDDDSYTDSLNGPGTGWCG